MLNLVLISENERERNILTIALEQRGFKVHHSESKYQSYVFVMQFLPDVIIIELPYSCIEQLNFTKRIRTSKKTEKIPIVAYGNPVDNATENGIRYNGVSVFMKRPLKFGILMKHLENLLRVQKKTLSPKPELSEKEQDITLLLNSDALPTQKIDVLVRYVSKLIAFPFSVAKVLKITQDAKTGAGQLAKAVNADPYMVTYLLKVANSVFFASANRRISTIKDAVVRIGFNETKRIVLSMSVMKLFEKENKIDGFDRIDFWYHSLATALCAERIAKNFDGLNLDEVFLAGLLHDFGIILFDDCFPHIFEDILEETSNEAGLFYDFEMRKLQVSHLDLIGEIFPNWKIPQIITEAIKNQYTVLEENGPIDTNEKKFAFCISFGNQMVKLLHLGRECDEWVVPIANEHMSSAKLSNSILPSIIKNIQEQIEIYRKFLGLEKRSFQRDCPAGIKPEDVKIGICNLSDSVFIPPLHFFQFRLFKCEMMKIEELDAGYNEQFHIIICWSAEKIDSAIREKLLNIKRNTSLETMKNEIQFAPLIDLSPRSEDLEEYSKENARYIKLDNHVDYRKFEMKVWSLLSPATTDFMEAEENKGANPQDTTGG